MVRKEDIQLFENYCTLLLAWMGAASLENSVVWLICVCIWRCFFSHWCSFFIFCHAPCSVGIIWDPLMIIKRNIRIFKKRTKDLFCSVDAYVSEQRDVCSKELFSFYPKYRHIYGCVGLVLYTQNSTSVSYFIHFWGMRFSVWYQFSSQANFSLFQNQLKYYKPIHIPYELWLETAI